MELGSEVCLHVSTSEQRRAQQIPVGGFEVRRHRRRSRRHWPSHGLLTSAQYSPYNREVSTKVYVRHFGLYKAYRILYSFEATGNNVCLLPVLAQGVKLFEQRSFLPILIYVLRGRGVGMNLGALLDPCSWIKLLKVYVVRIVTMHITA